MCPLSEFSSNPAGVQPYLFNCFQWVEHLGNYIVYMLRKNWFRMCNVECMRLWFPAMPVLVTVCCMGYITNNNVIGARICSYFTTYYEP
jgi:hypothetical protein